ncbi:hypothetical protein B0T17DRAFT_481232 [Bombardia bombarda]|uniref:Uncharacterized protein n=1 Tax=Bombardia bombarda TaxID=252184 RepID=A0AA39XIY9_9PEZI|nr:hypothetical protein B0T17DRAFT_481232 [Bombardia bombarda]
MAATTTFTITPEKEASQLQFFRRQFLTTPPAVSPKDFDLRGKTAIVTGSNIGIGLECARQLLDLGLTTLILAVRDEAKGDAAAKDLSAGRTSLQPGQIQVWKLDLSSYPSVTAFAERARTALPQLHYLILNAGIYRVNMVINPATGHEEDMQTNYLSTALLVLLFIRVLSTKNAPASPGKIVMVSSDTAGWTTFAERDADPLLPAFDDKTAKWDMQMRYGASKLLGQLFLTELARRIPPSVAVVNAANPGFCYGSGLTRDAKGTLLGYVVDAYARIVGRSSAVGARTLVDAAVRKGRESHGQYVEDGEIGPMAPIVYKPEGARVMSRLWKETLDELSFAGVKEIVGQFSDRQ